MYICMYIRISICMFLCMCLYLCIYLCMCVYVCTFVLFVCKYFCIRFAVCSITAVYFRLSIIGGYLFTLDSNLYMLFCVYFVKADGIDEFCVFSSACWVVRLCYLAIYLFVARFSSAFPPLLLSFRILRSVVPCLFCCFTGICLFLCDFKMV